MTENRQTKSKSLVILEKNQSGRDYLRLLLSKWGYTPFCFDRETTCLDNLLALNADLVILGELPAERLFRMLHAVRMIDPQMPILISQKESFSEDLISANGFAGVRVMTILSPLDSVYEALEKLIASRSQNGSKIHFPQIVGNASRMLAVKKMILNLSRSGDAVLVSGDAGTGKELAARAIHFRSPRAEKPFIKIDCSLISEDFTTARIRNSGGNGDRPETGLDLIGKAHTGTLFIKEIGLTPHSLQSELLLIVEEGAISNASARARKNVDIRIIASTTTDLNLLAETGRFRKDLLYRLNVFTLELPMLSRRKEDIPLLMDYFADRYSMESGAGHLEIPAEGKIRFQNYMWPGNVSELEARIKAILQEERQEWGIDGAYSKSATTSLKALRSAEGNIEAFADFTQIKRHVSDLNNLSLKDICQEFVMQVEKKFMEIVLEHSSWNRKKAAELLDISYKSLLNKMKAYGI
ncbi:MAG: sigma 54-interacting transcriptional regulator [Thermodesulfobacteriota bacterium]